MKFQIILRILLCLITLNYVKNESCPSWSEWQNYKTKFNIQFYNSTLELIGCQNFIATNNRIMNQASTSTLFLAHNKYSHWSLTDGILHKGLYYGDSSYNDFGRKKRKLLDVFNRFGSKKINSAPLGNKYNYSNYYGMPYKIYSPTPGYQYKDNIIYTHGVNVSALKIADLPQKYQEILRKASKVNLFGINLLKGIENYVVSKNFDGNSWFMDSFNRDRDQGVCGNCWAFTAVGSIEGAIRKKYNKVVHLSVQQLTDCSSDSNYGNDGCQGGNVWNAYRYIYENGIIEDSAYPFYSGMIGSEGQCRFKNGLLDGKPYYGTIYNMSSFIWVKQGDDKALMEVLDKYGPVAVAMDSSNPHFVSYSDGAFGLKNGQYGSPGTCRSDDLDHSTLLVGFMKTPQWMVNFGYPHSVWKLKNQWGNDWSNEGFAKTGNEILLSGSQDNMCGISTLAFVPVLA